MKTTHESSSESATQALATRLAETLQAGDVVTLQGPLGAGKTLFAQALARALGVEGPVTSPTYALVNRYPLARASLEDEGEARELVHVDLYRLDDDDEVFALGIWDDIAAGAIVLVEWPERSPTLLAAARVRVGIADIGATSRRITIDAG